MPTNKEQPLVSVIIVHYKNDAVLQNCLRSLSRGIGKHSWEIIVIRNDGITNNDALFAIPGVDHSILSIIVNEENLGFGKACNQGAKIAKGKFLLFLNPDTVLTENSISDLIDFYVTKDDCGIAAPMILDPDGSIQGSARSFPSLKTAFFGRTSLLTRLFPSNRFTRDEFKTNSEEGTENQSEPENIKTDNYSTVDWVSGAAILIKKPLFDKLDGFDERFFMYWEDADLCFRLSSFGLKVYYCKNAVIKHDAGACSKENKIQTIIEFHKSVNKYYCKNINRGHTIGAKMLRLVIALGICGRCIIKLIIASLHTR